MLAVEHLQSAYGPAQVLFDIGFSVGAGEVVTLLGRNGMGKTTTIRTIMGLLPATGGSAVFDELSLIGLPPYPDRAGRPRAGARRPADLSDPDRRGKPHRDRRRRASARRAGRWTASTTFSRSSPNGGATWAMNCPAASSRCWRSAAPDDQSQAAHSRRGNRRARRR